MPDWVCVAVCRYENGQEINKTVLDTMMTFSRKQKGGVIDVWWMYDDGGETYTLNIYKENCLPQAAEVFKSDNTLTRHKK